MESTYFYALGSALAFSSASLIFTLFARKLTVAWMNAFKAIVAFVSFGMAYIVTKDFSVLPSLLSVVCFFCSGLIGLNLADFLLVKSFKTMGPSRTLMIFSFQPLFLGFLSFLVLDQALTGRTLLGILFMMSCVFCISYEQFHRERKWDVRGPLIAFAGMILDSFGILLTRSAFEIDRSVTVLEGNFYRTLGACAGFFVLSLFYRIDLKKRFVRMNSRARLLVITGAFLGTFAALWMHLSAIRQGHLATVTAIVGTAPVLAAIFESVAARKKPSRFLVVALILFAMGFYAIINA